MKTAYSPSDKTWSIAKTLLLVHSEPHIRDILDICLSYLGWKVLTVGSPLKGLDYATQYQPDVIIFDMCTDGMNFFAFVKRLRMESSTKDIPILLIANGKQCFKDLMLKELNIIGLLDYPSDLHEFQSEILTLLNWDPSEFCIPISPTERQIKAIFC